MTLKTICVILLINATGSIGCEPSSARAPTSVATKVDVADDGHPFDDDVSSILGRAPPPLDVDPVWVHSQPLTLDALRGRVVLLRWLMSPACPMCSATVPVLEELHEAYGARGLSVIGVYHHKDSEPLSIELVQSHVTRFGLTVPIAIDRDWKTLRAWWLTGHEHRRFTSVSFLLDRRGLVRHLHVGGKLAKGTAEYLAMRRWIESLLDEPPVP